MHDYLECKIEEIKKGNNGLPVKGIHHQEKKAELNIQLDGTINNLEEVKSNKVVMENEIGVFKSIEKESNEIS